MTRARAYRQALRHGRRVRVTPAIVVLICALCAGTPSQAADAPPGPRVRPGIPVGVTLTTEHPGGDLAPGLYDRVRFTGDVKAGCSVAIFRSSLPSFRSTCGQHANRPLVAFSAVGGEDRCYGDIATGLGHFILWADDVRGSSDAVRFDGGDVSVADSRLRSYSCSATDHNDAIQAYGTGGQTLMEVIHCDIDGHPFGTSRAGNAAIFAADYSTGHMTIDGNILAGGGYTLGLHESMSYSVTNNVVAAGSYLYAPVNVTTGATIDEWSYNRLSDGTPFDP